MPAEHRFWLDQQSGPGGLWQPARQGGKHETISLPPADNPHIAFQDADLVAQYQQLGLISGAVAEGCEGEVDEEWRVKVGQALDAGRPYLLNLGGLKALELVPLIRILAGRRTGEEACYFDNRLESNQVRWVSYHFQPDPELLLEDPDVVEFLSDLQDKPSITQPT